MTTDIAPLETEYAAEPDAGLGALATSRGNPLPDRAAVTGLRMECAGSVVEGVLKVRAQAREAYDRAIAAGQRAAIAEEDRPDVFTMRVGNIVPGERVTVRL